MENCLFKLILLFSKGTRICYFILLRSLPPSLLNYWGLVQPCSFLLCMIFIKSKSSLVKCPWDFANFLFCLHSVRLSCEGWWWSRRHKCLLSGIYYWAAVLPGAALFFFPDSEKPWPSSASQFLDHKYEEVSWACTLLLETDGTDTCENIHSLKKAEHIKNCKKDARNNLKKFSVTDYSCLIFSLFPLFIL